MTPQELKNSILQLAIQGRLVEQRPEEGTAEELYRQIQREKAALVKAGKIKKEKPLPEIAEEEVPFEIPEGWKWVRIAEIWTVLNGDRGKNYPSKETLSKNGIPFISALNLDGKTVIVDDNLLCLSQLQYDKLGNGKLIQGDIVVCIRGSLGKHGRYPFEKGAIASSLVIMRSPLSVSTLDNYLMWYLDTPLFFSEIKRYDNGTAQPNLAAKSLEQFLIPLPPLPEQKRIVAKIEELLPLVDRYEKAWTRLEDFNKRFPADMQKSILQLAIQGRLVEQRAEEGTGEELYRQIQAEKQSLIRSGKLKKEKPLPEITEEEIPFEIPESWQWVRLGNIIFEAKDGPHFSPEYQDSGIPFISTRNISTGKLDLSTAKYITKELHEELCKRCKPKKWDVLYSKGGTTGIAAVNDSDQEFSVWVHVAVLSLGEYIYPYYLAMALNSPHCFALSQEYTHGTSNRDLGLTRMVKITLPLPPLAEQKRIVDKLEELLPMCERLK